MNLYEKINESIELNIEDYKNIVKTLYDNPEIGNKEFKSMELLTHYLENQNFEVEKAVVVPTDFIATYKSQKDGPTIAFMCEYDALPEVGHGCAHNMIAAIGVASGVALKSILDDIGGTVQVIGTPAEENFGGKVSLSEAGVFDKVDVALMVHPGHENGIGGKSSALNPIKFEFFGKTAHGCDPYAAQSALDAAVMSFVNINMLRQFVKEGTYIHGIIRDGGEAANVIPGYASLEYYFRAPTMKYAQYVTDKAEECVKGACMAAGVTYKKSVYECPYDDTLINYTLAHKLKEKYNELGLENIKDVNEVPAGSTDVGATSYRCPTLQGGIKICGEEVNGHSIEMASATITDEGTKGLINASKAIAYVACDLIEDKDLLEEVKTEFENSLKFKK